jgi:hypothetical protein
MILLAEHVDGTGKENGAGIILAGHAPDAGFPLLIGTGKGNGKNTENQKEKREVAAEIHHDHDTIDLFQIPTSLPLVKLNFTDETSLAGDPWPPEWPRTGEAGGSIR